MPILFMAAIVISGIMLAILTHKMMARLNNILQITDIDKMYYFGKDSVFALWRKDAKTYKVIFTQKLEDGALIPSDRLFRMYRIFWIFDYALFLLLLWFFYFY